MILDKKYNFTFFFNNFYLETIGKDMDNLAGLIKVFIKEII
jgi:hypothetical protein